MTRSGVLAARVALGLTRVWSGLAAAVLAAFFLEHLAWFRDPAGTPPLSVFAATGFHLLFLVGLALGWRRERLGGVLTLVGAGGFLLFAGAGPRMMGVVAFLAVPGLLWLVLPSRPWPRVPAP
jgi:hypothetical protein